MSGHAQSLTTASHARGSSRNFRRLIHYFCGVTSVPTKFNTPLVIDG
jgi:hypothetical protein